MSNVLFVYSGVICLFGGVICLQIFLSKKEGKLPGLILPFISFGFSVMALLGVLLFSAHSGTLSVTSNGEVVEQVIGRGSVLSIILSGLYVFLLYNIPTGILLAIYFACRGKKKRQRDLDKMSAQDLE